MRIFILGSSGMLGAYLKSFLQSKYELICPNRKDIDFCDDENKRAIVGRLGLASAAVA